MSTAARIDELLSKFDENPRRYFAPLANEYRKAGDLTQAIALCREHLPKQPGHMSGHIVFGQALFEHGDLAEAQTVFEAALALDPENLIALRHLGDIARGRGDALTARRWYGRVLEADPRNDDIAALLASLPSRATPMSTPAVAAEPAPIANDAPVEAPSYIDEPAWHTPAILGESAASSVEEIAARAEPELLDLDSPVEQAAEVPSFLGAAVPELAQADDAFGAEPLQEAPLDVVLELDAPALPEPAAYDFEALHIEEVATDELDASSAYAAVADDIVSAADAEEEAPRDALSDAIGAFASHDPLDSTASLVMADEERDAPIEAASSVNESPVVADEMVEYGEGLEAIEWPDASQLAMRTPTPVRSVTPVDAWPMVEVSPVADDPESLLEVPVEADANDLAIESLVEAPVEAEVNELAVESLVEAPEADETAAYEVESLVDAPVEAEVDEFAVESLVEASFEAEVDEFARESLVEAPVEDVAFEVESLVEATVEADADDFAMESLVEAPAEPEEAVTTAPLDEDPPFSAGEMPWLMNSEEEREAEEADLLEASAMPESPAFVTETMAELLVAQGFVSRAVGVYEELVARRPDEPALAERLASLRASLEPVPAAATPVAPLAAFTPARSATPRAVPFVAPPPRRTAREWLSVLATMQVARRTPMAGQVTVSMPTPADGLASLFGAAPMPADDVAARSLATAFGGAVPLDSSAPLFASGEFTLPHEGSREPVPAAPAEPANGSGLYSFDRFFPDPATTASGPSASSDAPTATSPSGSAADDPTSPGADLAQFSHWLKGLSNS